MTCWRSKREKKSLSISGRFFVSDFEGEEVLWPPYAARGGRPSGSLAFLQLGPPNPELGPDIERLNWADWVIGTRNFNVHWAIPAQQRMCITLLVSLAIGGHLLASKRGKSLASA